MSNSYRDLVAWQQAMDLVELIYKLTLGLPDTERYGLVVQLRRAAVSVASNIAEGQGRNTVGEFAQFLGNAKGSLLELETQVLVSRRMKYVSEDCAERVLAQADRVSRLLNGLMLSLRGNRKAKGLTRNEKQKTRNL
jgi:four helix bundle protein